MRKFNVYVNGVHYEVDVEEVKAGATEASRPVAPVAPASVAAPAPAPQASAPQAAPKPEAPKNIPVAAGATKITAPMPGNILSVKVKEGETVKSGQILLILEAMKMENEIMSPVDGTVVSVQAKQGSAVNGGDLLVVIQ